MSPEQQRQGVGVDRPKGVETDAGPGLVSEQLRVCESGGTSPEPE